MASRKSGIGRGLAAILPDEPAQGGEELREIPVGMIVPNPDQPRKTFDSEALDRLAESVGEAGVIQPLVVHPLPDGRYELIAGERRWRAAQQAGLEAVPAVLRTESESLRLQTALIENMAREDLNPVEEARACAALVEDLGVSKEEIARRTGRSRPAISNLIRLLDLPDQVLDLLESSELSEGHGRALLAVKGQAERRRLAREAAAGGWSVRETERRAKGDAGGGGGATVTPHPDQEAALGRAEDALERALGCEVRVAAARRGLKAEIRFSDLEELLELAGSLSRR
ncbi:MAG TPA: ParB/RepB/Spo0J family partition protein [Solirubrobacterales bacterium]|nr:ParB/RepB/Spo0J family partition protein [Solirubrobacterales bacterium]